MSSPYGSFAETYIILKQIFFFSSYEASIRQPRLNTHRCALVEIVQNCPVGHKLIYIIREFEPDRAMSSRVDTVQLSVEMSESIDGDLVVC